MKKFLKVGAASGALALVASMGFGSLAADAAVAPAVTVNTVDGIVEGPLVTASIAGCSVEDGATNITALLYSYHTNHYVAQQELAAPATGAAAVEFVTPLPGEYDIEANCYSYDGSSMNDISPVFQSNRGLLDLAGPDGGDTWNTDEPVTLTSPVLPYDPENVHAFDPGSVVKIYVIGPDGVRHDLGTELATALGDLETTRVLPFTVDGTYEVFAEGVKTVGEGDAQMTDTVVIPVLLYNSYSRYTPPAPEVPVPPVASVQPVQPPVSGKPTAMPKTGSEGQGLIAAASLISVVLGGVAVGLRSRKH